MLLMQVNSSIIFHLKLSIFCWVFGFFFGFFYWWLWLYSSKNIWIEWHLRLQGERLCERVHLLLTWILGVASKQLRLLHGRVGDFTIVVNSLSPQMSELVEDASLLFPDSVTLLGIFGWSGMVSRNLSSSNLNFSVLTLSMFLRYFGNELYNRRPNTVIWPLWFGELEFSQRLPLCVS